MMILLYEMLREAGLRLPRAAGQAISIVGGLVLGDAAIRAGLVSTPIVVVVALTMIASFVVSPLLETTGLLSLVFIVLSALCGSLGILLGLIVLLLHLLANAIVRRALSFSDRALRGRGNERYLRTSFTALVTQ